MSDAEAQTWGPDCHPLSYFLSIHLEMAAGRVSDKFHDGMGFLTQHASLTNEFELALQALDPTVTIPYWDYTREGEAVFEADTLAAAWDTELWNDTWFGSSGGPLHTVTTGRFAYQVIGSAGNASLTSNPYGLLRAPWNVNKSPFVSRLHKFCNYSMGYSIWPRCETHWNLTFSASYDSFYDWIWQAGYAPHGPVHYYIGGYTNCGDLLDELEYVAGADSRGAIESFARMMVVLPKQLYRAFMTNSPTCAMDVPQEECHMICTQSMKKPGMVDDFMRVVTEVAEGLSGTGIPVDYKWLQTMNESQAEHLANVFCTTPFSPGEQIEAASPVDVSFWPIHPTVERLLQYKRLVHDFTDTDNCKGHHATDMTLFKSRVKTEQGFDRQFLSNIELLYAISPETYRMGYIYDNFKWDHCADKGWDFPKPSWVIEAEGDGGAF
ncbi:hypothetical protein JL720_11684 [Aureococcus anophagefferens]|nr:hypothetical protein JL720_11684 [Aureococcus anophagefferens]